MKERCEAASREEVCYGVAGWMQGEEVGFG